MDDYNLRHLTYEGLREIQVNAVVFDMAVHRLHDRNGRLFGAGLCDRGRCVRHSEIGAAEHHHDTNDI